MQDIDHQNIDHIREVTTVPAGFRKLTDEVAKRFNTTPDAMLRRIPAEALCRMGDAVYVSPTIAQQFSQRVI